MESTVFQKATFTESTVFQKATHTAWHMKYVMGTVSMGGHSGDKRLDILMIRRDYFISSGPLRQYRSARYGNR